MSVETLERDLVKKNVLTNERATFERLFSDFSREDFKNISSGNAGTFTPDVTGTTHVKRNPNRSN